MIIVDFLLKILIKHIISLNLSNSLNHNINYTELLINECKKVHLTPKFNIYNYPKCKIIKCECILYNYSTEGLWYYDKYLSHNITKKMVLEFVDNAKNLASMNMLFSLSIAEKKNE